MSDNLKTLPKTNKIAVLLFSLFIAVILFPGALAAIPTADINADGSNGPITVPFGSTPIINWSSQNAVSCDVNKGSTQWASGLNGTRTSELLSSTTTFNLNCVGVPDANLQWSAQTPGGTTAAMWGSVAMAASGTPVYVVDSYNNKIFASNNGTDWSQLPFPADVSDDFPNTIAASANGRMLIVSTNYGTTPGYLYTSTNSGIDWSMRPSAGSKYWHGVAISSTGQKMAAVGYNASNGPDRIHISTDWGTSWAPKGPTEYWYVVSMSSNGQIMAAIEYQGGVLYISTDGGETWNPSYPAGAGNSTPYVTVSPDGSTITAISGWMHPDGGYIYVSKNNGGTWTNTTTSLGRHYFKSVATSSNASTIVATANNDYQYISKDGGATWVPQQGILLTNSYFGSAVSADGKKLIIERFGGGAGAYVYTSGYSTSNNEAVASDSVTVNVTPPQQQLTATGDCNGVLLYFNSGLNDASYANNYEKLVRYFVIYRSFTPNGAVNTSNRIYSTGDCQPTVPPSNNCIPPSPQTYTNTIIQSSTYAYPYSSARGGFLFDYTDSNTKILYYNAKIYDLRYNWVPNYGFMLVSTTVVADANASVQMPLNCPVAAPQAAPVITTTPLSCSQPLSRKTALTFYYPNITGPMYEWMTRLKFNYYSSTNPAGPFTNLTPSGVTWDNLENCASDLLMPRPSTSDPRATMSRCQPHGTDWGFIFNESTVTNDQNYYYKIEAVQRNPSYGLTPSWTSAVMATEGGMADVNWPSRLGTCNGMNWATDHVVITRAESAAGPFVEIATISGTTIFNYRDYGLVPGKTYYYTIKYFTGSCGGNYPYIVNPADYNTQVIALNPPVPGQAIVSWPAAPISSPVLSVCGAASTPVTLIGTGYSIERLDCPICQYVKIADTNLGFNVTTFVDSNAELGKIFNYRITPYRQYSQYWCRETGTPLGPYAVTAGACGPLIPNNAPLDANAGPDRNMDATNTITIDGNAVGGTGVYDYNWRITQNPGNTCTLTDANTRTPRIYCAQFFPPLNNTTRTATVRLDVNDSNTTDFDDANITIHYSITPAVTPLIVDAGEEKITTTSTPIMLNGNASGGKTPYIIQWATVPLDPNCSFGQSNTLNPSITCTTPGARAVRLTVTDSNTTPQTKSDDTNVIVMQAANLGCRTTEGYSCTLGATQCTGGVRDTVQPFCVIAAQAGACCKPTAQTPQGNNDSNSIIYFTIDSANGKLYANLQCTIDTKADVSLIDSVTNSSVTFTKTNGSGQVLDCNTGTATTQITLTGNYYTNHLIAADANIKGYAPLCNVCIKQAYFVLREENSPLSVPDMPLIAAVIILIAVLAIILPKNTIPAVHKK